LNAPVNEPNNRGRNEITSAILEASPGKCLHAGTPHYARCSVNNATPSINSFAVAWNEETALERKEEGGKKERRTGRKERKGGEGESWYFLRIRESLILDTIYNFYFCLFLSRAALRIDI